VNSAGDVVYLVDDDAGVRESLQDLLESYGKSAVTFPSAAEYLAYPRNDSAACLLLDLELPEMNGLDLQQQLSPEVGPPVIFVSGQGDIPATVKAMKAGAIEFLTKPVDAAALLAAIELALARDRELRKHNSEIGVLRARHELLTKREREVLPLVISGLRNKQAAAILGISEVTLQVHRGQIMRKMCAGSFAELVRMGAALGIVSPASARSQK
jgi:FixJ family two-component response regulator